MRPIEQQIKQPFCMAPAEMGEAGSVLRALVVDDDPEVLRGNRRIVSGFLGILPSDVLIAGNRQEALKLFSDPDNLIRLILTDGRMSSDDDNPSRAGVLLSQDLRDRGYKGPLAIYSAHLDPNDPEIIAIPDVTVYRKPADADLLNAWLKGAWSLFHP